MNLMMLLPLCKTNVIISPSRKDHIHHSKPNCEVNFGEDPRCTLPPATQVKATVFLARPSRHQSVISVCMSVSLGCELFGGRDLSLSYILAMWYVPSE